MKKLFLLIAAFAFFACSGGGGGALDQTKPEEVVKAVFKAAKSKDFTTLKTLCDPKGENDGDTRRICELTEQDQAEFCEFFSKGEVSGSAQIQGDEALVPFKFGPDGSKSEEMKLVNRDGKWYLYSF